LLEGLSIRQQELKNRSLTGFFSSSPGVAKVRSAGLRSDHERKGVRSRAADHVVEDNLIAYCDEVLGEDLKS